MSTKEARNLPTDPKKLAEETQEALLELGRPEDETDRTMYSILLAAFAEVMRESARIIDGPGQLGVAATTLCIHANALHSPPEASPKEET